MSHERQVAALRALGVFPGFTDAELEALVGVMHVERLSPGQLLFKRGAPGAACYLLLEGTVRVWIERDSGPQELAVLGRGELFGQMAVLDASPRSANCSAVDAVQVLRLDRDAFDAVFRGGSSFAYKFIDVLTRILVVQLRRANQRVADSNLDRASVTPDEIDAFLRDVSEATLSCDLDDLDPEDLEAVVPAGLEYLRKSRV